jgi:hypothetical protein
MATEILASNRGRINVPTGPFLDARGEISPAWRIWLLNPNVQSLQAAAPLEPYSGGLGVSTAPAIGQLPVATSTGVYTPSAFTSLPLFTSTSPGLAPASGGNPATFLRGDGPFAVPPTFTSTTPGYSPASGGGAKNFLRADGVYATPAAGTDGQVQYVTNGAFAAGTGLVTDGAGGVTSTVSVQTPVVSTAAVGGISATTSITAASAGLLVLRNGNASTAVAVGNSGASTTIGLYGVTPVTQQAAYVKTYTTASRTVPNATFVDLATTAAVNAVPYGFATQAQADAIATKVNALGADVIILKQLINSLINDQGSTTGGIGVNAT